MSYSYYIIVIPWMVVQASNTGSSRVTYGQGGKIVIYSNKKYIFMKKLSHTSKSLESPAGYFKTDKSGCSGVSKADIAIVDLRI